MRTMTVHICAAVAIVAALSSATGFGQATDGPVKTVRVSGRLLGPNNLPLEHQTLTIKEIDRGGSATTQTDDDGRFTFPAVSANQRCVLVVEMAGWSLPWTWNIHEVACDTDLPEARVQTHPVRISGRVVDFNGAPLSTAVVTLNRVGRGDISAKTGPNGSFSFQASDPYQRYSLHIDVIGLTPATLDVDAAGLNNIDIGTVLIQPLNPTLSATASCPPKRTDARPDSCRISGRIIDANDRPIQGRVLKFANRTTGAAVLQTDRNGFFVFPALSQTEYGVEDVTEQRFAFPSDLNSPRHIGSFEISGGHEIDFGRIAIQQSASKDEPTGDFVGSVTITSTREPSAISNPKSTFVAAIFVDSRGVSIIHADGDVIREPKEKDQIGCSSLRISEDRSTVGWLVDSPFCCASYPLSYMLVVYRPGKTLRRFTGDGRAIFGWGFLGDGKSVAFTQSFPHGDLREHNELRDVDTGRLIGSWDPDLTTKAPPWTRALIK